jgi:hypothetical protein
MEELRGKKINEVRTEEALTKNPDLIATRARFVLPCLRMG